MSNNYWTDWQQNKKIEAAEASVAAERRARSRLADQMRTQQGNLQGQIDRLTKAMVALIDHEDIRAELGQYADAAACRRYAREVVSTVVVTGGAALRGSVEPADVPGYWLAAAARGVAATAQGEARGAALLTEAQHRDPRLTAQFLCLLSAQTRDPRWATGQLATVLPDQPTITTTQRELWLAIAEQRLTDTDAPAQLAAALTRQVAARGSEGSERVAAWLDNETEAAGSLPSEKAAARLNALLRVLTSGARGQVEVEPALTSFLGGDTSGEAAAPDTRPEDPLADCLRSLVDQGSPGEGDILDRMATARAGLGFLDETGEQATATWSAPAGDVVDLLLADLEQPVDSPRHSLARQVLAPTLRTLADEVDRQGGVQPASTQPVKVVGEIITVSAEGATTADTEWQARVVAGVAKRNPINPVLVPLGIGLLAAGVVSIGLAFVASGFAVLAVLGVLGGLGALIAGLKERRDLAASQRATIRSTGNDITQAGESIRDQHARSMTATQAAQSHLEAIHSALGAA